MRPAGAADADGVGADGAVWGRTDKLKYSKARQVQRNFLINGDWGEVSQPIYNFIFTAIIKLVPAIGNKKFSVTSCPP
jgi:hypothetical protein